MDIAYYISDLLGQQGELTVPNLGYFVQIRMPAYYDSKVRKFFPPHFSVQFDPQIIDDDDALANHITALKKISVASAKYFIEKYIANLKSQAVVEDIPFSNLGTFSSDGTKLIFSTNTKTDDPAFFAYLPVDASKLGEAPLKKPVEAEPVSHPIATSQPTVSTAASSVVETVSDLKETETEPAPTFLTSAAPPPIAYNITTAPFVAGDAESDKPFFGSGSAGPVDFVTDEDEEDETYQEEPKALGIWIIVAIAFTLLIIGLGVLYKFKPQLFQGLTKGTSTTASVAPAPVPAVAKTTPVDSLAINTQAKNDSVKADSLTAKSTAAVKPSTSTTADKKPVITTTDVKKPASNTAVPTPTVKVPAGAKTVKAESAGAVAPITKGSWVIHAGAVAAPLHASAMRIVNNLKTMGFTDARLEKEDVKAGNNYKIIVGGVFKTKAEADEARKELLATGKLKPEDLIVEKI